MAGRWTATDKARIAHRRLQVARLLVRGMTLREIEEALPRAGVMNPERGGKPYSLATISHDFTYIKQKWQEEAEEDIAELKARQLAELRDARRKAWADGDTAEVRRNIETEMKLLGTKAAEEIRQTGELRHYIGVAMELPDNKRGDWKILKENGEPKSLPGSSGSAASVSLVAS